MNKRELLLTEDHFDKSIQRRTRFIAVSEEDAQLPADEVRHDLVYLGIFNRRVELAELKYSRGYPIEEVKQEFLAAIKALEQYKQHPVEENFFFNGEQDEYMQAVTLLSIALLLHVDADVFRRLADAIGAAEQDYVLEWLISRRLPERLPTTTKLLFPKTYARLRDALQAPPDLQPQLLRSFLAGWYESLDTTWYNIHAHRLDAAGFTGYWCWEAAAAAYSLCLDDTELQTMRYYPKDLADYAFGRKPTLA
ncbi:hypothetical protein HNQ93_000820 [Hymenobacter luteus]|uniref:DUF1911 domain-containing protein n=2 Tax=Hymenobacter TaxID=89966 RepID=A0A7W9SZ21_9BACT|nr:MULTISPECIES: PoNe immunity protein domain-containing protein [Hymenobacter]MBB4599700.1 hypothetical protein [Hymenobacter latericoloratus]MBB6057990.1 hypothetical protein [Hymenobacter luteus]